MASSSSSTLVQLGPPVSEKLTRDIYLLWKAQFLPTVRGAQLMGILDGSTKTPMKILEVQKDKDKETIPNPEYDSWLAKDQLLSYLLNSVTKEVLTQVASLTSSLEVWKALEIMFLAQSKAQVTNLRIQLSNLKKGSRNSLILAT